MAYETPRFEGKLEEDLATFLGKKLVEARQAQNSLMETKAAIDAALEKANQYVLDCESKLKLFGLNAVPSSGSTSEKAHNLPAFALQYTPGGINHNSLLTNSAQVGKYDPNWSYLDKIRFVLRNPSKYGFDTFKGASSVVQAIFEEEPDFKPDVKTALIQVAPQVSRVVKTGGARKVASLHNKVDFHFISAEWFDEHGNIKPQHQDAVRELDLNSTKS
ncbi:hypothetical protein [Hymenobacter arizonensis]|uniref:Uncharacterized protein n=1 Tax=Hymenobacter arizonensis TaxID=1227077 RepID=A0A1I5XIC6_HYMAR|nr:hypothetical protein [Hymenobacter arizonensis]SFQ31723.1 hypothetical protein SAMN04515668_1873 [Hymenobacter arizonensis]